MKKKRFLSLILMLVMLVSTLVMSGCGTEKKSGNEGNYDGELVYDLPNENEAQAYLKDSLAYLWDENKRHLNPQEYPVDLSTLCWENKHKRIFEVAEHVKEMEEENE